MTRPLSELSPSEQVFQPEYWQEPISTRGYDTAPLPKRRPGRNLGIGQELLRAAVEACIATGEGRQTVGWETREGIQLTPITQPAYFNQPGSVLIIGQTTQQPTPFEQDATYLRRLRVFGVCYTPVTAPAPEKKSFRLGRLAFGGSH